MNDLINMIVEWANARNLIKGSSAEQQSLKLLSEVGELADAVAKNDLEGIKDAIGDCFVVATIIAEMKGGGIDWELVNMPFTFYFETAGKYGVLLAGGIADECLKRSTMDIPRIIRKLHHIASLYELTLEQCVQAAYDEIKDRRGYMHNGIFIKESDPLYKELVNER